jgi:hypothetical protein
LIHLDQVLNMLQQDQWKVKLSKCAFVMREISYLGYVINAKGASTCPDKILAVADWPTPTNAKELRSFLGLAGYYRRFVKFFGVIAKPLTELLKKHTMFVWQPEQDMAF